MTIDRIKTIISQTPVEKMKIIKTKCRPPEKSNEILELVVDGEKWFCERPRYNFSKLGLSFMVDSQVKEGYNIYGTKEKLVLYDNRGLWWVNSKLSSIYLLPYYLENPLEYLKNMSKHMVDVQNVITLLKEVSTKKDEDDSLIDNINKIAQAYYLFYLYPSTVFLVFDELVYQFKLFLLKHFDKKATNVYLTKFLQAEITKEVVEKRYGEKLIIEKSNSRDVLYASGSEPLVYYRRPKFFHEYEDDMDILEKLVKKNISEKELKKFHAFRWMVPVAVQINEEAQYVESQMLSAHTSYIFKKVARKLGKEFEDLEKMTYQSIIKKLERRQDV